MPHKFTHPIRAVIFDIYGTLMEFGPPPADAEDQWRVCWAEFFPGASAPDLCELSARCGQLIRKSHAESAAQGVECPEVNWQEILCGVLPELSGLDVAARDTVIFRHQQCLRSLRGAAEALPWIRGLKREGILLGIASNAQAYTLTELAAVLPALRMDAFHPDLCLWSYRCGFSKPNPRIFSTLTERLAVMGVHPTEILMVGDRLDNDVTPALRAGWQAWHLSANEGGCSGPWRALIASVPISG
jgi:FMN phosphatase YigB (HAD superfamily)